MSSLSNTYAYIETLLIFGKAYKTTFLTNWWYKDTAGHMNDIGDENADATKQRIMTAEEKNVDMIGYIYNDVFMQV